ncbi:RnfABCDGE type electron transport complex subunit D [Dechloromonas sp. XY25]|uniref:Ion-translocating oxidoreductase complex subunit D n=1 Tax=Dechloromonas hankyongensis TaxID=2908002 RepID=A0ABS9K1J4_9RHOO|nr:RnfABCDGE type electron transport complex subunit D [Dechloromonas hankyongensis]MCG2577048.1 RnfABCDGE type electron transport complex subunit D [Dechloromonas hankyongensis]
MEFNTSPYLLKEASVQRVMLKVLLALLPGVAAYVWLFGPAILVHIALTTVTALVAEAVMLKVRGRPVGMFLSDLSAIVTAWLIALTFPPLAPWWLTVTATLFAIVIAKQLYGGLGQNPFNPAMIAYAISIVSFPALMSQWPGTDGHFASQLQVIFGLAPRVDGLTSATPLDALKTALMLAGDSHTATVGSIRANPEIFGLLGGRGWEWIALGYLVGGLWLIQQRIITWHMPTAFIVGMTLIAAPLWLWQPDAYASPLFHLLSGGAMLGAFFIVTDPVTGATTPRGKLVFAAGIGLLAYLIRVFGGYPDGVAFAVLLLNICVPLIDMYTQPPVFGMKDQ